MTANLETLLHAHMIYLIAKQNAPYNNRIVTTLNIINSRIAKM
jgi:hypothetical protein